MLNNTPDIFIIIPVFNEAKVIDSVLSQLDKTNYSIIVIDDASEDGTQEKIKNHRCVVIKHLINRGQGAALKTGIEYAIQHNAKIIVTYDADGQHRIDDITILCERLQTGMYDIVLGSRFLREMSEDHIPTFRKILLKLAIVYTRITTGLKISDTHNGLRAFTREAAEKIRFSQDRMAHATEILEEISLNKLRYCEVPVTIYYTEYSLGKGQKFGDFVKILFKLFVQKLK